MAGTSGNGRSESEKENTKMRERQRRAITTKIFHGLCKHDGYHLYLRGDINEAPNCCPTCGTPKATIPMVTTTPTLSSSVVIGGGECSTIASPSRFPTFKYFWVSSRDIIDNIAIYCPNNALKC
ncbi:hypothetical protein DVH24_042649 [Malus domestica]|uniref:Protein BZR1 homolog n=1 Tax=Malus domestica TaxID=3750 RepID=A0A498I0T8_MALDO|nr:hypothetical protein DVH24_042649 [Malus domestica]